MLHRCYEAVEVRGCVAVGRNLTLWPLRTSGNHRQILGVLRELSSGRLYSLFLSNIVFGGKVYCVKNMNKKLCCS